MIWFCKLVHSKAIRLYQTSMFSLSEFKALPRQVEDLDNILGKSYKVQILKRKMYPSLVGRRRRRWWLISENHSHTGLSSWLLIVHSGCTRLQHHDGDTFL